MARKQVIVQLEDELVADLDILAEGLDVSRSEVLRRAARHYLEVMDQAAGEQLAIESYRRYPEDPGHWAAGYDDEPARDLRLR